MKATPIKATPMKATLKKATPGKATFGMPMPGNAKPELATQRPLKCHTREGHTNKGKAWAGHEHSRKTQTERCNVMEWLISSASKPLVNFCTNCKSTYFLS